MRCFLVVLSEFCIYFALVVFVVAVLVLVVVVGVVVLVVVVIIVQLLQFTTVLNLAIANRRTRTRDDVDKQLAFKI